MDSNNSNSYRDADIDQQQASTMTDALLERQVQRLVTVQTYLRWLFDLFLWLTLGAASIWALRSDIELWIATFTWAAVRVTLMYNRLPMLGIGLCVAMTLATLVWQSSIIIWGINPREKRSLLQQIDKIKQKGRNHWLWRWVCEEKI